VSRLKQRLELYRHAHGSSMPLHSIARLISTMLYGKRFFPYYVYNILGGVDEQGRGAVYSFDPVGSYEREFCRAAGAAQSLLQPFLDSQVSGVVRAAVGVWEARWWINSSSSAGTMNAGMLLPECLCRCVLTPPRRSCSRTSCRSPRGQSPSQGP